ncbi:hypothetical protein ABLO03_13460, partial [Mycobacterium tuberculosis]
ALRSVERRMNNLSLPPDKGFRIYRERFRIFRAPLLTAENSPATDQGLRYEPRRPPHIEKLSQTENNAAVTALTSADTPASAIPIYGCSTSYS